MFALYPGHMWAGRIEDPADGSSSTPSSSSAVGAVSIEHLGATSGSTTTSGYRATGEIEIYGIWTTQGEMFEQVALPALVESGLQRHALLKPPVQITPGRAFHWLGVPHVSGIAGPTYLLKVTDNGEMASSTPTSPPARSASTPTSCGGSTPPTELRCAQRRPDARPGRRRGGEREYRDPSTTVVPSGSRLRR